ncbi:LPS export ABC transporter permease LptF [Paludibacterium yongneupense]|uniref:LPS export ABC transporter permease LptF n=1 Tax=Paludibacterium yongneupense TaxID=400061 RepID=UPI00048DE7AE|nr:LPS export ABC transporter permease LptF [Paludibacterium yongneupense]
MVFQKSLIRELTFTAIGVFVVLLAILASTQAINLLGRAAEGQIANDAVAALIGFWTLGLFPVLLILTVFVSVMIVLTRLWREHEMSIWLTAGLPLSSLLGPVLRFAVPLSILVGIVSCWVGPWADQRSQQYAELLKQREEISAIAPGVFKESAGSNRVYFVESFAGHNGFASNIFFQDMTNDNVSTIFARSGHISTDGDGQRQLVLEDGQRYIGQPGKANYDVMAFKRYTVAISESHKLAGGIGQSRQAQSMKQLLARGNDQEARAEIAWRLSLPLSCLVLAILALPLSYFNPRSGHTYNLVLAILIYFLYQNGLTLIRNNILRGELHPASLLLVHAAFLLFAFAGLAYRNRPSATLAQTLKSMFRKA